MFPSKTVQDNLQTLTGLFAAAVIAGDPKVANFYSKLAIQEVCGWTEECMDEILNAHKDRMGLTKSENRDSATGIIESQHGFTYEKHFRKTIKRIIGIFEFDRLEEMFDEEIFFYFNEAIKSLATERNSISHTSIESTPRLTTPSTCVVYFRYIKRGLFEIEDQLEVL